MSSVPAISAKAAENTFLPSLISFAMITFKVNVFPVPATASKLPRNCSLASPSIFSKASSQNVFCSVLRMS